MCTKKHVLVKKMFRNKLTCVCYNKPELKRQFMKQKNTDASVKKKVLGAAVCKEGHADSLLRCK